MLSGSDARAAVLLMSFNTARGDITSAGRSCPAPWRKARNRRGRVLRGDLAGPERVQHAAAETDGESLCPMHVERRWICQRHAAALPCMVSRISLRSASGETSSRGVVYSFRRARRQPLAAVIARGRRG
jgi:hypothetical protein